MKILAIETSCDETSIALIEKTTDNIYKVIAHETISQINLHREYGGVFPTLSKREHEKNLIPLLQKVLSDGNLIQEKKSENNLKEILGEEYILIERYAELTKNLEEFLNKYDLSEIKKQFEKDFYIAITNGPGLPPALWVGVNFAKVLSKIFGSENSPIPIYPINHMEGHIVRAISRSPDHTTSGFQPPSPNLGEGLIEIQKIEYPVVNLLISGGHTELVLSDKNLSYKKIGETQDDAVGECFDKVARLLDLPYPGGPEIGKLAKIGRKKFFENNIFYYKKFKEEFINLFEKEFPRPMMHSDNLNFSFSGLKTHILYLMHKLKIKNPELSEEIKIRIATEFEEAIKEILICKTKKAIEEYGAKTLVVGGGVASSHFLREAFLKLGNILNIQTFVSDKTLATDNALMIALTAANQIENNILPTKDFIAIGSKNYNVW
jgi:N6-L-threonylcarbamoyladenine synthase